MTMIRIIQHTMTMVDGLPYRCRMNVAGVKAFIRRRLVPYSSVSRGMEIAHWIHR